LPLFNFNSVSNNNNNNNKKTSNESSFRKDTINSSKLTEREKEKEKEREKEKEIEKEIEKERINLSNTDKEISSTYFNYNYIENNNYNYKNNKTPNKQNQIIINNELFNCNSSIDESNKTIYESCVDINNKSFNSIVDIIDRDKDTDNKTINNNDNYNDYYNDDKNSKGIDSDKLSISKEYVNLSTNDNNTLKLDENKIFKTNIFYLLEKNLDGLYNNFTNLFKVKDNPRVII
jgi:hypothetical protein